MYYNNQTLRSYIKDVIDDYGGDENSSSGGEGGGNSPGGTPSGGEGEGGGPTGDENDPLLGG
jgi:hypothetical protein